MNMQVGGPKGSALAEMNVVPLIDILLVLLIIFMVITPTTPKGLEALVPQPAVRSADIASPPTTIVVQVLDNGKLKINQEESSWGTLGGRLEAIFKQRAEKVAFIKGGENVFFSDVARAVDIMRRAGVDKVGLITAKLEAGQS
jgi:biopolymer transport protein TolR